MKAPQTCYTLLLGSVLLLRAGWAQDTTTVTLKVDVENAVNYWEDVSDVSKLATEANTSTGVSRVSFQTVSGIYDIAAVNGKPAKETVAWTARNLNLSPTQTPRQRIADISRNGLAQYFFEFLRSDGTSIGTIMLQSFNGGTVPPGSPVSNPGGGSQAIVGGTGAFIGVTGQSAQGVNNVAVRQASMAEDPSNRRTNGGGKTQFTLQLIPLQRPQVVIPANGPAIVHANTNELVTAANPARAGETLVVYATGLGPVKGVEIGERFPASPPATVLAPVDIMVNGAAADVLYAGGYSGPVDGYQVNFTLPSGTVAGTANLQLFAAWIPGESVKLPIQ